MDKTGSALLDSEVERSEENEKNRKKRNNKIESYFENQAKKLKHGFYTVTISEEETSDKVYLTIYDIKKNKIIRHDR